MSFNLLNIQNPYLKSFYVSIKINKKGGRKQKETKNNFIDKEKIRRNQIMRQKNFHYFFYVR